MPGPLILTLRRIAIVPTGGIPPEFSTGEEGDTDNNTIEITFNLDVFSTAYAGGVTLKINAVAATLTAAVRQTDHAIVHYTITEDVDIDDAVTFEYDDDFGDYEAESDGTDMLDITSQSTTNYVGSQLYFNEEWASAHRCHL